MRFSLLAGASAMSLGVSVSAMAAPTSGNIILTGHDNELHCFGGSNACAVLGAETSFVRSGSTLPVLAIDNGTELTNALTHLGIPYVQTSVAGVTAADFNTSLYSAFVVASVSTCGGCDNPVGTGTALAAFSTAIASFYNAGGGILGLTEATDTSGFAYVPQATGGAPIGSSSGFVATAAGTSDIPGFMAVNGDQTHNIFTSDAGYTVAETSTTDGGAPVTIFLSHGTIVCTGPSCSITPTVPEPVSLSLLGAGLFGLGVARRRHR